MAPSWMENPTDKIGYCINNNGDRRFRCEDSNVAFTNVQPHNYHVRQVEPCQHLGWSSQALILSILALGAMPQQQQHQQQQHQQQPQPLLLQRELWALNITVSIPMFKIPLALGIIMAHIFHFSPIGCKLTNNHGLVCDVYHPCFAQSLKLGDMCTLSFGVCRQNKIICSSSSDITGLWSAPLPNLGI